MAQYSIKVIDTNFKLLDIIEDFKNPFFNSKWYDVGECQIDIDNLKHVNAFNNYQSEDIIVFLDAGRPFVVTKVHIDSDANTMLITGKQLKNILNRRIIIPPTGEAYDIVEGDAETIMKDYVDRNCVTTTANRVIANLQIAANQNRGISTKWQARYDNLLDVLKALTAYSNISFDITLDLVNKKFIFDTYEGLDRTDSQSTNKKAVFSIELNTLTNQDYDSSNENYKNYGIVGGKGEDTNREIVEVEESSSNTGLKRREVFIDGASIDETTTLEEYGKSALAGFPNELTMNAEAKDTLVHGTDYNNGDLVTVLDTKMGIILDTQITEITENFSDEGYKVHPTFGTNSTNAIDVISSAVSNGKETSIVKTLYNNATGSNSSVTLSETAANFDYIELFFYTGVADSNYGKGFTKVYSPNGMKVRLSLTTYNSGYEYRTNALATISGTSITLSDTDRIRWSTDPSITITANTNQIYIYRVVGYK